MQWFATLFDLCSIVYIRQTRYLMLNLINFIVFSLIYTYSEFDTYKFTKNWDRSMLTIDFYNLIFKQHSVNIWDLRTLTSEILFHYYYYYY